MKFVLAFLIIAVLALAGWKGYEQWEESKASENANNTVVITGSELGGMPGDWEGELRHAKTRGASGVKDFLRKHRSQLQDPRLADIELDYVVLVAKDDVAEARTTFARVKSRVPPSSPIYPRIKQLEKTYQ